MTLTVLAALVGVSICQANGPHENCNQFDQPDERASCYYGIVGNNISLAAEMRRLIHELEPSPIVAMYAAFAAYLDPTLKAQEFEQEIIVVLDWFEGMEGVDSHANFARALGPYIRFLGQDGRSADALKQYNRAKSLRLSKTERLLLELELGRVWRAEGDVGRAYRHFTALERGLPLSLPASEEQRILNNLLSAQAGTAYEYGAFAEYWTISQRRLTLGEALGNCSIRVEALYGLAAARSEIDKSIGAQHSALLESYEDAYRESMSCPAVAPRTLASIHLELGSLKSGADAVDHLETCIGLTHSGGNAAIHADCLAMLGWHDPDPIQSHVFLARSLDSIFQSENSWDLFYATQDQFPLMWRLDPSPRLLAPYLARLDYFEALFDEAATRFDSARLRHVWSDEYYWLAGHLFAEAEASGDKERIAQAFAVLDRMRGQSLREAIQTVGVTRGQARNAVADRFVELAGQRLLVLKSLSDPRLDAERRAEVQASAEQLKAERDGLWRDLIGATSDDLPSPSTPLAFLTDIEGALDDDQALFSFQIFDQEDHAGRRTGGCWLTVSTRKKGTQAYRLDATRREFERAIEALAAGDALALPWLYARIEPAIASLPARVSRLTIIPDGPLHRLSFDRLRGEDGMPLVERFEITVTPSAALWRASRERNDSATGTRPALIVADPALPRVPRSPASESLLERLPGAELEGMRVREILPGSTLITGESASEDWLLRADLAPYRVIQFSTHAEADRSDPHQSAIALAPGGEHDGWLYASAIRKLDVRGKLVVLAACRTADGEALIGEGPLSLAREFLAGGARAVVATLEDLPDDEASRLIEEFYEGLARGKTVSASLTAAKRERFSDEPASTAWAMAVVYGDGDFSPFVGMQLADPSWRSKRWWLVLVGLVALLVAAVAFMARISRDSIPKAPPPS